MANSVNENNGVVEINKSEEKSTSISQDFCEEKQTHSSSIESSLSLKKLPKTLDIQRSYGRIYRISLQRDFKTKTSLSANLVRNLLTTTDSKYIILKSLPLFVLTATV